MTTVTCQNAETRRITAAPSQPVWRELRDFAGWAKGDPLGLVILLAVTAAIVLALYFGLWLFGAHQVHAAQAACPRPVATRTVLGIRAPAGCPPAVRTSPPTPPAQPNTYTPGPSPQSV